MPDRPTMFSTSRREQLFGIDVEHTQHIRWGIVGDPTNRRYPQAFTSANTDLDPDEIISCYAWRWQIEVTFA